MSGTRKDHDDSFSGEGMKLIVGLGNPIKKYFGTRHNIGREVVEFIGREHHLKFSHYKYLESNTAEFHDGETRVVLAYPEQYMNLSGHSVRYLVRHFQIDPLTQLLIVLDDVALPFGRLRLRPKGSDGGHNGLKSIQDAILTMDYARLRIGIGPQLQSNEQDTLMSIPELDKYVLAPFNKEEQENLGPLLEKSAEACKHWISRSIEDAMNIVNP